jgi:hypothetical protein
VNILDENIPNTQTALLESWRIHFKQIGIGTGRLGMTDTDIIPLLLTEHLPTFFTRDRGFYNPRLCHSKYCLVVLDVRRDEAASFTRRLLRHPAFNTRAKRMGKVVRVTRARISFRSVTETRRELKLSWFSIA